MHSEECPDIPNEPLLNCWSISASRFDETVDGYMTKEVEVEQIIFVRLFVFENESHL